MGVPIRFRSVILPTMAMGLWALSAPGKAAEPNWPSGPYEYTVVNQDLRSVLEHFGENMGVRVVLSDSVKGTVRGTPPSLSPRQFLDNLAKAYGLDWYYDGSVLAVSSESEEQTESVSLHGMRFQDVQRKLSSVGVLDQRYAFRPGQSPDTAVVAGPPHYVTLIAHELGDSTPSNPDGKIVIHDGDHVTIYKGPLFLPQ